MWSSEEEEEHIQRRKEPDGKEDEATDSDIEVAKKFVRFVSYVRDLPVEDFTWKDIADDAGDKPEKGKK
ncbi:hypothetical protein RF55_14996 [Lasius niger]|uniref:Uncharacterized protein n=1 Tax=Lasius niger TaxID=67767 RepID=A0A0J7K7G7_LASNI|nr:hypothetical protein RF55_14996 [Lasius niger]